MARKSSAPLRGFCESCGLEKALHRARDGESFTLDGQFVCGRAIIERRSTGEGEAITLARLFVEVEWVKRLSPPNGTT
jgi:hypothetical protein